MRPSKRLIPLFATVGVLLNVDAAFGCSTKAKAYVTAMKSDLRNMVSAQEAFHSDSGHFAGSRESLDFRPSTGTTPPSIRLTQSGWYAVNAHTQLAGGFCAIYVGQRPAALIPPTVEAGTPWCEGVDPGARMATINRSVANGLWAMLGIVTLTTAIFLSRGRGKWLVVALLATSVIYPLAVFPFCGDRVSLGGAMLLSAIAVTLLIVALRRGIGGGPSPAI